MLASMNVHDAPSYDFLRRRHERATGTPSRPRTNNNNEGERGLPEGYRCGTNADCVPPLQCVLDRYTGTIRDQNQKGICRKGAGGRRRRTKRRRKRKRGGQGKDNKPEKKLTCAGKMDMYGRCMKAVTTAAPTVPKVRKVKWEILPSSGNRWPPMSISSERGGRRTRKRKSKIIRRKIQAR